MNSHEDGAAPVERRLDDAFRTPEFDDARAERILTAARTLQRAERQPRGRGRGVRLGIAFAVCAALAAALVVWPSVRSGNRPAGSTSAPTTARSATGWSAAGSSAQYGSARERSRLSATSETASAVGSGHAAERSVGQGLWLSTELISEPVVAGDPLVVRLTLTNFWGQTVRWDTLRFGLSVTTAFQPDPSTPDGISIGGSEQRLGLRRNGSPFTLRSGESTTALLSTAVPAGTWQVVGSYAGDVSGHTPAITIIVVPRPPAVRKGP